MKYLVIAVRENGNYNATLYKRVENVALFDMVDSAMANETIITVDNYLVVEKGVMRANNIEDIETAMRRIGFRKCDICGNWVSPQDIRNEVSIWNGEQRLCGACLTRQEYENRRNPRLRLSGYHTTSEDVRVINGVGETFDLSNVFGIGIEVEINSHNRIVYDNCIKVTDKFYELANPNSRNKIFRVEHDGTVQAEIISNIFTKKSLYDFDWKILTDTLILNENDESIPNVGLHVHLSKCWLGRTNKEQALNFLKLQYILKAYENDFFKISGRKRDEMGWCQFYSMSNIERMKTSITHCSALQNPWDYMPTSHNYALINSNNTIELRIGKSTNDPKKIENYLKLILGIVENVKNIPFEKCYCLGRIMRLVPNEVMNYWRKQGCFLNTIAIDTRGITL